MARKYAPGPSSPHEMAGAYTSYSIGSVRSYLRRTEEKLDDSRVRSIWWEGIVLTPHGYVRIYAWFERKWDNEARAWTDDFNSGAIFECPYHGHEHQLRQSGDEAVGISQRALAREAHRFARSVVNLYRHLERAGGARA